MGMTRPEKSSHEALRLALSEAERERDRAEGAWREEVVALRGAEWAAREHLGQISRQLREEQDARAANRERAETAERALSETIEALRALLDALGWALDVLREADDPDAQIPAKFSEAVDAGLHARALLVSLEAKEEG